LDGQAVFFDFRAKIIDELGLDNIQSPKYIRLIGFADGDLISFYE
jgi:hypothetical protein